MPPSLQLPRTYDRRNELPGWPVTIAVVAVGLALTVLAPARWHFSGVPIMGVGLGWTLSRAFAGQTHLDQDGIQILSGWGDSITIDWGDVVDVVPRPFGVLHSRVRTHTGSYALTGMSSRAARVLREAMQS